MALKKHIVLVGGGGHCKSCIEVIRSTNEYEIVGILDVPSELGKIVSGVEVIGNDGDYEKYIQQGCEFLITVGQIKNANLRKKIYNQLKEQGAKLATIIASTAYVSTEAQWGEGNIIMHQSFINAGVQLGDNNIINSGALLEHDVHLGNHNHISTKAVVNGDVKVGSENFIGSSACIGNGVRIENNLIIGAGSVVLHDIKEAGTYVGCPVKKVEK